MDEWIDPDSLSVTFLLLSLLGGVMDRMDCQFLMALCTWVHYNTFVKMATVSVPRLTYLYSLLDETEKEEFLASIRAAALGKA